MNNHNFIFNSSGDNSNNNNDDNNYYSHTNNSDNLLALGQGDSMSTFNSASPTSSISPSSNNPGLSNNSNQAPSESVLSNFFHTTNNSNPSLKKLTVIQLRKSPKESEQQTSELVTLVLPKK